MEIQEDNRMQIQSEVKKKVPEKDRRIKVQQSQLSKFPYSCIGRVQFRPRQPKLGQQDQVLVKATAFLISSDLVLTSASNFFSLDVDSGDKIQLVPHSLEFWQFDQDKQAVTKTQIYSFADFKPNMQYFTELIESSNKQLNQANAEGIKNKANLLTSHDFVLIKLNQKIERPLYFVLSTTKADKALVNVTGYQSNGSQQVQLFTHSNQIQIINQNLIQYDIDTQEEQKGSPVYLYEQNQFKVIAIHQSFQKNDNRSYATAFSQQTIKILTQYALSLKSFFQVSNSHAVLSENLQHYKANQLSQIESQQQSQKDKQDRIQQQKKIQRAVLFNTRGTELYRNKDWHQAQQYYKRSVATYQKIGKPSAGWAAALHNMGLVNCKKNKFSEALQHYNKSLKLRETLNQRESIQYADTLHNSGIVLKKLNSLEGALQSYLGCLRIKQNVKGEESIECANTLNSIGRLQESKGNFAQALPYFIRQLEIRQKSTGVHSKECVDALEYISWIYSKLNEHQKAVQFSSRAAAIKHIHQ